MEEEGDLREIPGFPGYKATRDGKIYSYMDNAVPRLLTVVVTPLRPYPIVGVQGPNGSTKMLVHRLVAMAYCPNPDNLPQVNHIDGNVLNPHADNLEWCSPAQNIQHARETGLIGNTHNGRSVQQLSMTTGEVLATFGSTATAARAVGLDRSGLKSAIDKPTRSAGGFRWRTVPRNEDGEIWRQITSYEGFDIVSPHYSVSNRGNVRNDDAKGRPLTIVTKAGYQVVNLTSLRVKRAVSVQRLVAHVFLVKPGDGDEEFVVRHKDGNRSNNCAENLEWVTTEENMAHFSGKGLEQLDDEGNVLATYSAQTAAARAVGVTPNAISIALKLNQRSGGFRWRRVEGPIQPLHEELAVEQDAGAPEEPATFTEEELEAFLAPLME